MSAELHPDDTPREGTEWIELRIAELESNQRMLEGAVFTLERLIGRMTMALTMPLDND